MTHGCELRGWNAGGRGSAGQKGIKERKEWDNCKSIINKMYLKKSKIEHKWHMILFIRGI